MAVIINPDTEKVVAFRCERHKDLPALNIAVKFTGGHAAECAGCVLDQGADALLAQLGELIDKAATRLNFFEPGTGAQLKEQAATYLNSISHTLTPNDEATTAKQETHR